MYMDIVSVSNNRIEEKISHTIIGIGSDERRRAPSNNKTIENTIGPPSIPR